MKVKLFLTFLLLSLIYSTVFPQQTVIVDAKTIWQNTAINLLPNESALVIAQGSWCNAGSNFLDFVGPEGTETWHSNPSDFLVQGVNHMSLVGKIGENGTPFGIGSHRLISSTDGGTLFLSMNDRPNEFADNFGYLVVGIYKKDDLTSLEFGSNNVSLPNDIALSQNFPNPFNPSTNINFNVSKPSNTLINIYDINGQLVRTLINDFRDSGHQSVIWDGKSNNDISVSSGTYFYQITVGNFVDTKKMILLK